MSGSKNSDVRGQSRRTSCSVNGLLTSGPVVGLLLVLGCLDTGFQVLQGGDLTSGYGLPPLPLLNTRYPKSPLGCHLLSCLLHGRTCVSPVPPAQCSPQSPRRSGCSQGSRAEERDLASDSTPHPDLFFIPNEPPGCSGPGSLLPVQ